MGNAFTKKYLTELIDSRLAELDEPDGAWTKDEKLLAKMHRENIEHGAATLINDASAALQDLRSAIAVHEAVQSNESLRHVSQACHRVTGLRMELKYGHSETTDVSNRIQKERRLTPPNIEAEKGRLGRVKKYISESPENEFSLTLMKSLGFIDIIKQAING